MRIFTALIAGALVTPLIATTADAAPKPAWRPCPDNLPLECTTLTVPLDYRKPHGAKIDIAVSRKKAGKQRRGVLLLNPGGPGAAGLDRPLFITEHAPKSLVDNYDLIGFDPRGTGRSSPVSCGLTVEQRNPIKIYPQPAPNGDISESVAYSRQVARQCMATDGARLPHITTANTARDMDRIRIALGERKISYFGVSYGSYLGAVYTTLFPERSDRIVLDSVVNPDTVMRGVIQEWGPATDERFTEFASWAASRDSTYRLGATPHAVRNNYLAAAAKLDAAPVGNYNGNTFRGHARWMLYLDGTFPDLAQTMQAVLAGTYEPGPEDAFDDAFAATMWGVACGEAEWPRDIAQYQRDVLADRKRYPITNGMPSNIWPCAFWPKPVEPKVRITDRGPDNVLLVQNLRDPATPLSGAKAMRSALGDRAKLVTADQGGHGSYLYIANSCVTNLVTAFLVDGVMPDRDIACGKSLEAAEGLAQRPDRGQISEHSQGATEK